MLTDQFGINENDKELIGNVLSNIGRVPGDIEKVLGIIGNVPIR
jgi:hypothetical protein